MKIARFLHEGRPLFAAEVAPGDGWRLAEGPGVFELTVTPHRLDVPDDALLAPLVPTDLLGIGLNYRDHAAETNSTPPANPMLFIKSSNALGHPKDPVVLPSNSDKVDYEAELAVVIGQDAKDVSEADALDHVFGYAVANDVSARDWQKDPALNGGQFARGKSFDGFCPLGPHLVTADDVPDPQRLPVALTLNGETMQSGSTADMIFSVAQIVSSLSRTMTLRRGAVILTGTPAGVGAARTPPRFLRDGDVAEATVGGVGRLVTRFRRPG